MTRRRLLALVGAALGLVAGAAFVAPGAGAATPSVRLAVRDGAAVTTVDPGGHGASTLVVTNHDTRSHTIRLWLAKGTVDVPSWVLLADTEVTIGADASLDVVVSVDPPSTVAPGRIDLAAAAQVFDDGVPGTTTPTTPLGIVVRGTPSAVVRIADVSATSDDAPTVRVEVRNDGAVGADLEGTLTIAPSGERLPLHIHVDAHAGTTASMRWNPPRHGRATGRIELVNGNESVSWSGVLPAAAVTPAPSASTNGQSVAGAPATVASIVPPGEAGGLPWGTVLVVLGLLAASGWLGYEIVAGRRALPTLQADRHVAPAAVSAPAPVVPVDHLTPLVEAIALLGASIGGRPSGPNAAALPTADAVRNEVLGLVAAELGVSRLRLLDWLPDELFERAAVELTGDLDRDRLAVQLRAVKIEREILRRALRSRGETTGVES